MYPTKQEPTDFKGNMCFLCETKVDGVSLFGQSVFNAYHEGCMKCFIYLNHSLEDVTSSMDGFWLFMLENPFDSLK